MNLFRFVSFSSSVSFSFLVLIPPQTLDIFLFPLFELK